MTIAAPYLLALFAGIIITALWALISGARDRRAIAAMFVLVLLLALIALNGPITIG